MTTAEKRPAGAATPGPAGIVTLLVRDVTIESAVGQRWIEPDSYPDAARLVLAHPELLAPREARLAAAIAAQRSNYLPAAWRVAALEALIDRLRPHAGRGAA